jgi:hypothetical protein
MKGWRSFLKTENVVWMLGALLQVMIALLNDVNILYHPDRRCRTAKVTFVGATPRLGCIDDLYRGTF